MSLLYENLLRPILFKFDPELIHEVTCNFLGVANRSQVLKFITKSLVRTQSSSVELFGLNFPNCLGQAAGLDKDGRFPGISSALGFQPCRGWNRDAGRATRECQTETFQVFGFRGLGKSNGLQQQRFGSSSGTYFQILPQGEKKISSGNQHRQIQKVRLLMKRSTITLTLSPDVFDQADYIAINISSPNTPDLRNLHQKNHLLPLLKSIRSLNLEMAKKLDQPPVPCLLKISPDEDYNSLERIVLQAIDNSFDGIIATNTSAERMNGSRMTSFEKGGLSGKPIENKSTQIIRFISRLTDFKLPDHWGRRHIHPGRCFPKTGCRGIPFANLHFFRLQWSTFPLRLGKFSCLQEKALVIIIAHGLIFN